MESLNAMALFVQVATSGSFVAAARQRGLSPSAVSKGIARLEARLQVRLLNRSTRSVTLTAEGARFFERSQAILTQVQAVEDELAQSNILPRGRLRISLPAESTMTPLLAGFLSDYPEVSLEMEFTDRFVDVVGEGFDLVIRAGQPADSRLIARRLTPLRSLLVAAPDYLERAGVPQHPEDLVHHACLHYRSSNSGKLEIWQLRGFDPADFPRLPVTMVCNNIEARVCFARQGLGLAWLPDYFVRADIAAGALVSVLDDYAIRAEALWLLWPAGPYLPPKVRALVDYLGLKTRQE
ncbi:LysR family transcriptional regulator [Serratia inhibens]|uniref:LysR family transcriptional regulator n=1 Tax=Serratia inhibens TaxID=2338073 RepID=UPI003216D9C0